MLDTPTIKEQHQGHTHLALIVMQVHRVTVNNVPSGKKIPGRNGMKLVYELELRGVPHHPHF